MLIEKIDKFLLDRESHDRTSHYPSDAERCTRALWNDWNKVPISDPIDLTALWKMQMGEAIHDQVAYLFTKVFTETANEISFKEDIGLKAKLSGRLDNLIIVDNEMVGVEIKTSFGRGIVEIAKEGKPKDEHLGQVALYLKYSGVKKFILFYLGRDNAYRTEFEIKYVDDNTLSINGRNVPYNSAKIIEKFKAAEGTEIPGKSFEACIVNGEFKDKFQSDKIEYKGDWQCRYCKYRTSCWKDVLAKQGKFVGEKQIV